MKVPKWVLYFLVITFAGMGLVLPIVLFLVTDAGYLVFVAPAAMAFVYFLIHKMIIGPGFFYYKMQKQGLPAIGTLERVSQTGTLINDQPLMLLGMAVHNELGETWSAQMKKVVPLHQLHLLQPGITVFNVLYDPRDKSKLVSDDNKDQVNLDTPGKEIAMKGFQDIALRSNELYQHLSQTGIPATAKVLTFSPMGCTFNDNNPLVTMLLEVHTATGIFQAQVNTVIAGQSIHKYQPGCSIHVRYDDADKTRVCVTGSDKPDTAIISNP